MLLDCHTHAYLPEDLAVLGERLTMLDAPLDDADPHKWRIFGSGELDDLLCREAAAGADGLVLLPVSGKPARAAELNRWAADCALRHPQIIPFGMLHPAGPLETDLQLLLDLGIKGVKLHPFVQGYDIGSAEARAMLGLIAEAGLPVMLDTVHWQGLLEAKPHMAWVRQMLPGEGCPPPVVAATAKAFPHLRIIAAHGGGLYGWHRVEPLLDLDNVYFDLAYLAGLVSPPQAVELVRAKGPEKVMYGSDAPWRDPVTHVAWFEELDLGPAEREMVAAGNLMALLDG